MKGSTSFTKVETEAGSLTQGKGCALVPCELALQRD